MKTLLATALVSSFALVTGCAAAPKVTDHAHAQFPARLSQAKFTAADPLATQIARDHRGVVTAQVKLCVLASGEVGMVDIVTPSGLDAYDQAVLDTVSGWQYEASDAPACEKLSVSYRTP